MTVVASAHRVVDSPNVLTGFLVCVEYASFLTSMRPAIFRLIFLKRGSSMPSISSGSTSPAG